MKTMEKEEILSLLDTRKKSLSTEEAALALGGAELHPRMIHLIAELEREGRIIINKKGRLLSAKTVGQFPARIVSMSRHFAFARPESGEDVYIADHHLSGAMLRDTVLLSRLPDKGRGEAGKVERVLQTGNRDFTGVLARYRDHLEILPDDNIRYALPVEKQKTQGAKVGDKVFFTLSYDRKSGDWKPVIRKIYGKAESARVCADAILDGQGIPSVFFSGVIAEGKKEAAKGISEGVLRGRLDLRKETIFTIDGSDAKDLDDAVSVSRVPEGYRLGVHIADVSHYVRPGTELDKEAQRRGTSVYFADRVIPMLPTALSNGACSLNAGEDKLTFSCLMTVGRDGKIKDYAFHKSVIRSCVRGVYSEINRLFDGTADGTIMAKYHDVRESLEAARALAAQMKTRAERHGAMDLTSRESAFTLDEDGICVDIRPRVQGEAEELIERFMIAANQSAAELARQMEIPFVYRIHEPPEEQKLSALATLARLLGFNARRLRPGVRTSDFAKLLDSAKETRYARILSEQVLRSMSKARYAPEPLGHFGLSMPDYCHFTSPIRRYPDLAIHRILGEWLAGTAGEKLHKKFDSYAEEAARQSSVCELRAQTAERMAEDVYAAEYMAAHIGEEFAGIVSGVTQRGVFVELPSSVEGYASSEDFPDGRYVFEEPMTFKNRDTGQSLTVGDEIKVRCVAADVATARIDFVILEIK